MKRWLMDKSFIDMKSLDNLSVWFACLDAEQCEWTATVAVSLFFLFPNRCEETVSNQKWVCICKVIKSGQVVIDESRHEFSSARQGQNENVVLLTTRQDKHSRR